MITGTPPYDSVCIEPGCTEPPTITRHLDYTEDGMQIVEWVCHQHAGLIGEVTDT